MAHFHIKKKKGRPYLYVREIARVDGKPKVINQVYIGAPDRVVALAKGTPTEDKKLRVEEFGALWLANQIDQDIDLAGLVDQVVPRAARETGPSIGEYFLYCVLNRMVDTRSKNKIAEWYRKTAIQHIRPVDIDQLSSERYWDKWDRVTEQHLESIAKRFFEKNWQVEKPDADCLLFDTTNYYTFIASDTVSELAQAGHNKASRHHLRQIGLGLLIDRNTQLPLCYRAYPGNMHDSKLFHQLMDEMFAVACGLEKTKQRLTVVIDKGMNSEGNYAAIDEHQQVHFVTTYSTYFAEELAVTPLDWFEPLDIERNRRLTAKGKAQDCLVAYRTTGHYWGKERTVVVTHNPTTARKKEYTLDKKLEAVRQELLEMRGKVRDQASHWRNPDDIHERYYRLCEHYHIPADLFTIELPVINGALSMSFRRDAYRLQRKRASFGRNIIITDNTDWTTSEIVQASLDRWQVEDCFRLSNEHELVNARPVRHWTDSKIRCHLFTCVVAMTYLRRMEIKLKKVGIRRTAASVMEEMRDLHSVLSIADGRSKPKRRLETPTKTQAEVLSGFGHCVDSSGVLHPLAS